MKNLIIGILVFSGWSTLSTYIYVCKIKGLCDGPVIVQTAPVSQHDIILTDTSAKMTDNKDTSVPEILMVHFAFDNSDVNADTNTELFSNKSKNYLEKNAQARLHITGFADATGTEKYNMALGYRRAQSMQRYFEGKGMPANKIIILSRGEKEPIDDNNTIAGRANNRRAQIAIKN